MFIDMHAFDWGWWAVMSAGMVVFWVVAIWVIVWLIRGAGQDVQRRGPSLGEDPRAILQRRLAQGEISIEEYEQRLAALDDRPRQPHASARGFSPRMADKHVD